MRFVLASMLMGCAVTGSGPAVSDEAIIGGTTDEAHPSVVGVGNRAGAYCSGTVVAKRAVLTAGHCVSRGIRKVFFGTQLGDDSPSIAVVKVTRHPGYDEVALASGMIGGVTNDLAILELAEDAPVPPAQLFRGTLDNSARFIGPPFTFVGYGANEGSGAGFGTRRAASFPIAKVGPADVGGTPGKLDATMLYYSVPNLSACRGDSGGPTFFVEDGVEYLAGVTSFGGPRCASDGVHARADGPQIAAFVQPELDRLERARYGGDEADPDAGAPRAE